METFAALFLAYWIKRLDEVKNLFSLGDQTTRTQVDASSGPPSAWPGSDPGTPINSFGRKPVRRTRIILQFYRGIYYAKYIGDGGNGRWAK